ncbi:MAG TPA: hypothetical protein VGC20_10115, partial [bacterium]
MAKQRGAAPSPSSPPHERMVTVDGVQLRLALPDDMPVLAVGSESVKDQLRACWLTPPKAG